MVTVQVCIGSACHLGGSHDIITGLQKLISEKNLSDAVELKAVFCMGECGGSVCTRVNNEKICGVKPEKLGEFFAQHIEPLL